MSYKKKYYEKEKNCTVRQKKFKNRYVEKKEKQEKKNYQEQISQKMSRQNLRNRQGRRGGKARAKIKRRQLQENAIAFVKAIKRKERAQKRKKKNQEQLKISQWIEFKRQYAKLKTRPSPHSPRILETNYLRCERFRQNFYDQRGYQKASYLNRDEKQPSIPFQQKNKVILRSQLLYSYELQYYLNRQLENYYTHLEEQILKQLPVDRLLIAYLKSPQSVFSRLSQKIKVSSTFKAKLYIPTSPIVLYYQKTASTHDECVGILKSIYPKIKQQIVCGKFRKVQFYQGSPRPFILIQTSQQFHGKKVIVYAYSSQISQSHFREPYLQYQRIYPGLNSLFKFVKIFLTMKGLTNFAADGIDDYSIFLMALHSTQVLHRKKRILLKQFDEVSYAQDVLHFFSYYGFQHHYVGVSLSVIRHNKLFKQYNQVQQNKLQNIQKHYLEDAYNLRANQQNPQIFKTENGNFVPQLQLNDMFRPQSVSNNFKKISELKKVCQRALVGLHQNIQCGSKKVCYSYERSLTVERWEERQHRPCCLLRRLFKA